MQNLTEFYRFRIACTFADKKQAKQLFGNRFEMEYTGEFTLGTHRW